jgi:prepilin-type N-terminal cleavage/methylation domain-containing protein
MLFTSSETISFYCPLRFFVVTLMRMSLSKNTVFNKGFTLIELLIAVSIITIMTGALMPSFSGYIKSQGLKQSQEQIKNDLRTVQNNALTGAALDDDLGGSSPLYWGVRFTQGQGFYDYFISVGNASCGTGDVTLKGKSSILPGGVTISSADSCVFFSFKNGDSNGGIVSVSNGGDSKCVNTATSGLIISEECGE